MELSSDDLEDCVEKFRNIFLNHRSNKRNEDDLLLLVENLSEDLKISRRNEEAMQNIVKRFLESEDANITTKYVTLEEKYRQLEIEDTNHKKQIEELNTQLPIELEAQKNDYLRKIIEKEEHFNQEIANLRNQLESDKICYETKEKEFQNELQALQAASALQCDEIETNLQRQLVDATSKLRQSQNTIRSLQLELNNSKSQLVQQQKYNNTPRNNNVLYFQENPIQTIRNNVVHQRPPISTFRPHQDNEYEYDFENNVRPSSAYSASSRITEVVDEPHKITPQNTNNVSQKSTYDTPETQYGYTEKQQQAKPPAQKTKTQTSCSSAKYPPLPLDYFPAPEDDVASNITQKMAKNHCPVIYKSARQTVSKNKGNKNNLPPLMPCSDRSSMARKLSEDNKPRKRKLYNPDDLEYLQSLMETDE